MSLFSSGAGPKYTPVTKIGNWWEDRVQQEEYMKNYLKSKQSGQLMTAKKANVLDLAHMRVPLSFSRDNKLQFGMNIKIEHQVLEKDSHVKYVLANNMWEPVSDNRVRVTASPYTETMSRNVFTIIRPTLEGKRKRMYELQHGTGNVITYGQPIYFASEPILTVIDKESNCYSAPFLLMSEPNSGLTGAGALATKTADKDTQEVFMAPNYGPDAEFVIIPANGDSSLIGTPVPANAPVAIKHMKTNQTLACQKGSPFTSALFGQEEDVHCWLYRPHGKGSFNVKQKLPENLFTIVTSGSPHEGEDKRGLTPLTGEAILNRVRRVLSDRGLHGVRDLGKAFRNMDDAKDGFLHEEDLRWGLKDRGIVLSPIEMNVLIRTMDRNRDGLVSFIEFMEAIKGPMNPHRVELVHKAFNKLDTDKSGVVTVSDLASLYDTSYHPMAGQKSHEEILGEFMSQWDTLEKDGIVTFEEFLRYYEDVSCMVDADGYFDMMMTNSWKL
eukprot:TRINITY_DN7688_c0_g1_i1.p1 TRINITY_DN7688_c0_g1~~TRINITY_DN7688_c0_g1_i1.p1  ORF type:complete len:497 (+),score=144.68 TRINITY_DN7688_c0_g1_i1:55-1545(+)